MKPLSYKSFFFINIIIVCFSSLLIAGGLIYLFRHASITAETNLFAETKIEQLALATEERLNEVQDSLLILNRTVGVLELDVFANIMDETIRDHGLIRAIYVLDENGMTVAVGTHEPRSALHRDYLGIDFSNTPLFQSIQTSAEDIVWSDIFVSVLSGDTSVGAGLKLNKYTVIAELSLQSILQALTAINNDSGRFWVIDGRGELIADTENTEEAGILNVRTVPFMQQAFKGNQLAQTVRFDNFSYHVAYAESEKLGWLFLWGTPSGLYNERIKNLVFYIFLIAVSFLAMALIISPFWIKRISTDVLNLRKQAESIATNQGSNELVSSQVLEFKELSKHMQLMQEEIKNRETELKDLNRSLELKVRERTLTLQERNNQLISSMEDLQNMQEALVHSEKLASLGRLVAGVAHELNTPIGNSITSLSSLTDEIRKLRRKIENGLTKSDFEHFIDFTELSTDISFRNSKRAAELITSFKHVANDQTSSIRRIFKLHDVIHDVLLTLHPMIKKTTHHVEVDVSDEIQLNSYPGVIVQILTNLINNAFVHAWSSSTDGVLKISAKHIESPNKYVDCEWILISIKDNGSGIPEDYGQKVFDPFYTSKAGLGGTGLGLNIALNGARKILGGELTYESEIGKGTEFLLSIPLDAPDFS